MSLSSLARDKK